MASRPPTKISSWSSHEKEERDEKGKKGKKGEKEVRARRMVKAARRIFSANWALGRSVVVFSIRYTRKLFTELVDADVVDLISHGEAGVEDGAAIVATEGEVEEDVLGMVEGRDVATDGAVDGLGLWDLVEEFVVEVDTDGGLVPVHAPDVEARGPEGVDVEEVLEGSLAGVPYGGPVGVVAPGGIGEDMWDAVDAVELHEVYLAA